MDKNGRSFFRGGWYIEVPCNDRFHPDSPSTFKLTSQVLKENAGCPCAQSSCGGPQLPAQRTSSECTPPAVPMISLAKLDD